MGETGPAGYQDMMMFVFARPDLSQIIGDAEANRDMFQGCSRDRSGKIISSLRSWARRSVLEEAARYTAELTGSAVELPLVWMSNYCLSQVTNRLCIIQGSGSKIC